MEQHSSRSWGGHLSFFTPNLFCADHNGKEAARDLPASFPEHIRPPGLNHAHPKSPAGTRSGLIIRRITIAGTALDHGLGDGHASQEWIRNLHHSVLVFLFSFVLGWIRKKTWVVGKTAFYCI